MLHVYWFSNLFTSLSFHHEEGRWLVVFSSTPTWGHRPIPVDWQTSLSEERSVWLHHLARSDDFPQFFHQTFHDFSLCLSKVNGLIWIFLQIKKVKQVGLGSFVHCLSILLAGLFPTTRTLIVMFLNEHVHLMNTVPVHVGLETVRIAPDKFPFAGSYSCSKP